MTLTAEDTRVFGFIPSSQAPARRLRQEQRAAFDRDGFIDRIRIFADAEVLTIRSHFDRLLQMSLAAGKDGYAVQNWQHTCASIHDLVVDARILDCVEDVLGPEFLCWSTHCFCKLPGDERTVSWHQDAPYWGLTPTHTVTVWLAIDDVDAENAALQVLPGSHRLGRMPMRDSLPEERNVLSLTTTDHERYGSPVTTSMRAGEISMHSDLLIHGSEANRSARRRCALALRYCTADVRETGHWRPLSIHCRGAAAAAHWPHHPRPDGDAIPAQR